MKKAIAISHRGNTNGPESKWENNPDRINEVLALCPCEIDVWKIDKQYYLGHDEPQYKIKEDFLENPRLFCHAKNVKAFYDMMKRYKIHSFYHTDEDFVLTTHFMLWQAHYKNLTPRTIVVDCLPSRSYNAQCYGICTDYCNL